LIHLLQIGFLEINTIDVVDILLVSFLIYQIYKIINGSVAFKIFTGVISIYILYYAVKAMGMELLSSILGQFIGVGVLAGIILFQQEIRRLLLMIGRTSVFNSGSFMKILSRKDNISTTGFDLNPILEAMKALGTSRFGGLIVIPRSSELKFFIETGEMIDSVISKKMLITIFNKNSPMHDGAVILSKNRIKAARCILPVSESQELPANLGLRHRSALGLSEVTDAVILVVSEETGQFSLAHDASLEHNLSIADLKSKITQLLSVKKERLVDKLLKKETEEEEELAR
jgi:uncharacterized protein (TIGR00159 family)